MSYAVDALADFVVAAEPAHLPDEALMLLRRNVLDSVGCAIAALDGETVRWCVTRSSPWAASPGPH